MKIISVSLDLRYSNSPKVTARVVVDNADGTTKEEPLDFLDDEARDIVDMIPNPNGDGLVVHPDANYDRAKLRAAIDARLAEAQNPAQLAARIELANQARRDVKQANEDLVAAEAAKAKVLADKATVEEAVALKSAELAALNEEIARGAAIEPSSPA